MIQFDEHIFQMGWNQPPFHEKGDLLQVVPVAGDFAQLRNLEM